jgi:hypothetical protein
MANGISNGINKLVGERANTDQVQLTLHEKTWRDIRSKLDSLLIGTNVLKGDVVRQKCQVLDGMDTQSRIKHITDNWGSLYADRTKPLILQLETIEKHIGKIRSK